MTTYAEFQADLTRVCEQLRHAGLPNAKIEDFATRWLRAASVAELEEAVNQLGSLEKQICSDVRQTTEVFDEVMQLMDQIGQIAGRHDVVAAFAADELASLAAPKYPEIEVRLGDLDGQIWPILRRVSYAMSDAGVDDAEIEQFKNEIRSIRDALSISRRWVRIV